MIDPRSLRTFLVVCRENSITGASKKLYISQPAVSVTISQLEASLGVSLFHRSRSGITLTREGEALKQRAESMEILLVQAEKEVSLSKVGIDGPLCIGGTPGALVSLVPDAVAYMDEHYNKFTLHILERPDHLLMELLHNGRIEIAFVTTEMSVPPEGIEERSFSKDPFYLIVGGDNVDFPDEVSLHDINEQRWVLPEAQGAYRRQIDALFTSAEVPMPQSVVRCDSLLTTKAIVRGGKYITILPEKIVEAEISIGVLRSVRIKEAYFNRNVGIRTIAGAKLSNIAQRFIDAIDITRNLK